MVNRFRVRTVLLVMFVSMFVAGGCGSASMSPPPAEPVAPVPVAAKFVAISHADGEVYLAIDRGDRCTIEAFDSSASQPKSRVVMSLEMCPEQMRVDGAGKLALLGPDGSLLVDDVEDGARYVARAEDQVAISFEDRIVWTLPERPDRLANGYDAKWLQILTEEDALLAVVRDNEGEVLVRLEPGAGDGGLKETKLIEAVERIDDVIVAEDQKELAMSFVLEGSNDIAIVNAEEPVMNLVPFDPADEVQPEWSPVGYKLSYVVRNPGGDILRTVHVPTAAMVLVDFPDAAIQDYTWLPDGERVLVAMSSSLASDHVVEVTYEGSSRNVVIPAEIRFERSTDRVPGTPAGSLLVLPEEIRYTEKRPLVIWTRPVRSSHGLAFDPALIPVLRLANAGLLIVNGPVGTLTEAVLDSLRETSWVDPGKIWIVGHLDEKETIPSMFRFVDRDDPGAIRALAHKIAAPEGDR